MATTTVKLQSVVPQVAVQSKKKSRKAIPATGPGLPSDFRTDIADGLKRPHETQTEDDQQEQILSVLENELLRTKQAIIAQREKLAPKFTIQDAFDYDANDCVMDAIKGTLSVAYLLESLSEFGNEDLDGQIAQGFACALRRYAAHIGAYLKPKTEV